MCALSDARKAIDAIDDELVALFVKRQRILDDVVAAKRASGTAISDPERERKILSRVAAAVPPEFEHGVRLFFSNLFSISKARQREILAGASPLPERLAGERSRRVCVVGMGLIGGSMLKAAQRAGHEVVAIHHGDEHGFETAEVILVCLPPEAIVPWIRSHADRFAEGTVVVDIAGTKRAICRELLAMPKSGWTFVGGHPMAGREVSGYENSLATLFDGASMILVPDERSCPSDLTAWLGDFFRTLGFARIVVTTADRHDRMIAFTSQLCHVIATAYARDPLVVETPGFSAGSYADMTRIATQDPAVWSELFAGNGDLLAEVLDSFMSRLDGFRSALRNCDRSAMAEIIAEGAAAKRRELAARKGGEA